MKSFFALFGLFGLVFSAHALPQYDLIAQIHFAGSEKIFANANSVKFTNEFCSIEALALRTQTAAKLSDWLAGWLGTNLNTKVIGGSVKLHPLFDDLQKSEWYFESRAAVNGNPEVALAIKLDPTRAKLWEANLRPFFPAAAFKSNSGWLIFDSNPALMELGDRLVARISMPSVGWFDLDLNWPRLAQWYPELKELGLTETQFAITAPDDNFRINGQFRFATNLTLNLEPWCVPTNTLHQPFNSFSAMRGFATWLHSQGWAQSFLPDPTPNEIFLWSLPAFPFQTYAAIPVPRAADELSEMYDRFVPVISDANARADFMNPVSLEMTNGDIGFIGLPFIAPYLRALHEPTGQFLMLEPLPNTSHSKPLPPELFQRLNTKNLVFYHWEITAQRMPQLLQLSQFGLMMTRHKQLDSESASFKWLQRIGGAFGNTDTEIVQSGPAEMTFTRKAPGIFTAIELFALANWLEATNFPGCDLRLPPPSPRLKQLREERMHRAASPVAPAPGQ